MSDEQELAELMANPIQNVYVEPSESNVLQWKVVMIGPVRAARFNSSVETNDQAGTPYEGGKFGLDVVFGHDFPFKAPKVSDGAAGESTRSFRGLFCQALSTIMLASTHN